VLEAPQLESIIEIHEVLGELVQIPVLAGIVINAEPGGRHRLAGLVG
jgi:hypothetical protein